ncbi:MAG: hypothetical protein AAF804_18680 [Bacteroidota bacterium]
MEIKPDPELSQLLRQLDEPTPPESLVDVSMDRIFALAREQRSSLMVWKKGQRIGLISLSLSILLGFLGLMVKQPGYESMATGIPAWVQTLALTLVAAILFWQIDGLLSVFIRRKRTPSK